MLKETQPFIIGDIHGCFDEVGDLLDKAGASVSRHKIYLLGDLINKGPYSYKTLRWARENGIPTVIGNHEMRFLQGVRSGKSLSPQLKELADQLDNELDDWLNWIDGLPNFIDMKDFLLVHGGIVPGQKPQKTDRKQLCTLRTWTGEISDQYIQEAPPWHDFYEDSQFVYYGHYAGQGLHRTKNTQCLDSGCVYGKSLSGIWHGTEEVISTPARKVYCQIRASRSL